MISTLYYRFTGGVLVALLAIVAGPGLSQEPAASTGGDALSLSDLMSRLRSLEESSLDGIWTDVAALDRRAREARPDPVPLLTSRLPELGDQARLAAAALLLERRESFEDGRVALQRLAREAADSKLRVAAIRLLSRGEFSEALFWSLGDLYRSSEDSAVRIEIAAALLRLDDSETVRRSLVPSLMELVESTDSTTRQSAALVLAEAGEFHPAVSRALRELSKQPTQKGRLAASLYARYAHMGDDEVAHLRQRLRELEQRDNEQTTRADEGASEQEGWASAIREILEIIEKRSLYFPETDTRDFVLPALRSLVASVDEYSRFVTSSVAERAGNGGLGAYWGIGVHLIKTDSAADAVVARAYRAGPAFAAGLRAGDRILEINGVPTRGLQLENIRRIRAESQSKLRLRVASWDNKNPVDLAVEFAANEPASLDARTFPRRIGYIRIPRFTAKIPDAVQSAITRIERECAGGGGTSGWILDLRDNPGGSLAAAIRVVDLFVSSDEPIVTLRNAAGTPSVHRAHEGSSSNRPAAVLVNALTASAAEVVAGALQDFRRATVIGERTFGKGVEQKFYPLPSSTKYLGKESGLWLTQRRFYLPHGRALQSKRRFDHGALFDETRGVLPDIEVASGQEVFRGAELGELERVMFSAAMHSYVQAHYATIRREFDCERIWSARPYPGLDALRKQLEPVLSRQGIRHALQRLLRHRLEDEKGTRFASNYATNPQLQRAILEILHAVEVDPNTIAEYAPFAPSGND